MKRLFVSDKISPCFWFLRYSAPDAGKGVVLLTAFFNNERRHQ